MQSSVSDLANTPVAIRDALLGATSSSEALNNLYRHFKQTNRKYSLPYICRQAGIPSSGYLSDVLKGKRRLHGKYRAGITKAFQLSKPAASYLRLLIDIDNEKRPEKIALLREKLAVLQKALGVAVNSSTENLHRLFFALEVFCAFGLFRNAPTRAELRQYFALRRPTEVDSAVDMLQELNLATDKDGCLRLLAEQVFFPGDERGLSHFDFLRLTLAHAAENLERWFDDKSLSHYESSIISVRREHFLQVLPELKARLLMLRSDLEAGDADMLIRLNVQLYPV